MALNFDGIGDYLLSAADSSELNAATVFSISFWYAQDMAIPVAPSRAMVSRQQGVGIGDYFFVGVFGAGTGNRLRARCDLTSGGLITAAINGSSLPLGVWQHVLAIYDQTGGNTTISLYKDAALLASISGVGTIIASNEPIIVAANKDDATTFQTFWPGRLDDLRIYTRGFTPSEIQTIYGAQGKDGIVDRLIARYPMNEQGVGISPDIVPDITGRNDMQLVNKGGAPFYVDGITTPRQRQPLRSPRR
jgi:hypothetical protein